MRPFNLLAVTAVLCATCGAAAAEEKDPQSSRSSSHNIPHEPPAERPPHPVDSIPIITYEVWAAQELTRYFVIVETWKGGVSEYAYSSEARALQVQAWYLMNVAGLKDVTVESRVGAGRYDLIETFGDPVDALDLADLLESFGLYVEIRTVNALQFGPSAP